MTVVALFWAPGCHLCEPAKATARAVCAELAIPLEEIDISGDAVLEERHRTSLPVIEIDGRRAFKFFVDEGELRRRLLRATSR